MTGIRNKEVAHVIDCDTHSREFSGRRNATVTAESSRPDSGHGADDAIGSDLSNGAAIREIEIPSTVHG